MSIPPHPPHPPTNQSSCSCSSVGVPTFGLCVKRCAARALRRLEHHGHGIYLDGAGCPTRRRSWRAWRRCFDHAVQSLPGLPPVGQDATACSQLMDASCCGSGRHHAEEQHARVRQPPLLLFTKPMDATVTVLPKVWTKRNGGAVPHMRRVLRRKQLGLRSGRPSSN